MADAPVPLPDFVRDGVNLASGDLGAAAVFATDDFFAPVERMLQDAEPVWREGVYDDHGKWMDGWESRRRRGPGHDFAVVRLAAPGRLLGFDVDTRWFTGNYPPACRVEGWSGEGDPRQDAAWETLVPMRPLGPSSRHFFPCDDARIWTHLRLHIHPDGGVARFRAYGRPVLGSGGGEIDLAAALNGARPLVWSDAHYGALERLLYPGRGRDMGDGWETRRRREPGHDWMVIRLAARGRPRRALIDTRFYKGNFPDSVSLQAADLSGFDESLVGPIKAAAMFWPTLLDRRPLGPDAEHVFDDLADLGPVTHLRLNIHPDGGVSRLRLWGSPED